MRILIFLHALALGGVEQVALRLCRSWADHGEEIVLMLGRHSGALPDLPANVTVLVAADSPALAAIEDVWMAARLPGVIAATQPDIIFCAGNTYAFAGLVARLVLGKSCPPIVVKISNDLQRMDLPRWIRRAYHGWCRVQGRLFEQFVAIAPAMRHEIVHHVSPARPVRIIPDAVLSAIPAGRPSIASELRDGERPGRRFIAIGRLAPQKNPALLLEAFASGSARDDTLTIIGDGRLRARLEQQAVGLGLGDRICFVGADCDVASWLCRSDALLLTSRYEGMPAVIVEALAHGVPVLTTACCASLRAMFADGRCGALVEDDGVFAFAKAIASFDPGRYDRAAMRALASSFTVASAAQGYIALFQDLVGTRVPAFEHGVPAANAIATPWPRPISAMPALARDTG